MTIILRGCPLSTFDSQAGHVAHTTCPLPFTHSPSWDETPCPVPGGTSALVQRWQCAERVAGGLSRWQHVRMFRRVRWWWAIPAGLVLAGLVTWLVWPSEPAPRARVYRNVDACLLTDGHGLSGGQAAAVWAGMQDASGDTRIRVSYLAVQGEDTVSNALPYLAGLLQRGCDVVLAAGPAEVSAVAADARKYPKVRFVVVGGTVAAANVTDLGETQASAVRAQVKRAIVTTVGS